MYLAIVVAAGEGRRMGFKKQFLDLAGRPMWLRSAEAMLAGGAERVVVVTGEADVTRMREEWAVYGCDDRISFVQGGATRHESVTAGMRALLAMVSETGFYIRETVAAVHDGARPFVQAEDVVRVYTAAAEHGGAVLGKPCRDTVKWVEGQHVERTISRDKLFLAETPQAIRGDWIQQAYFGDLPLASPTDDSSLMEALGIPVAAVESNSYNGKVTTPADLAYAEWLANRLWGSLEDHANRIRI
ncbi:2-C-methyl-D-erythritol 4-phosphate cytidylyltransferase [Alicyclobacillus hesperidum subsp. aegles]|uniref:2-C-methyl-D-erythritol 4-phosphate cytidylyltransferase n=1 Tax=Alicyclobacillus hesperidum TaxID=89784 RepID=A0A1H2VH68_9BACL|nr:IspD/TarI family cytidylyltransferase [Alicyclobacillus hesperidum]GLG02572.1 2-C-methyl-D-erythritol 4-phosphate cytidylyltransferase [Alicyclobacillus hesperidum subsp. aegles]SDW67696.1 2-C-methyl-D-erythritol 4-phosphate cytidylyltransferase [Alicyclobacillus hesperidum]